MIILKFKIYDIWNVLKYLIGEEKCSGDFVICEGVIVCGNFGVNVYIYRYKFLFFRGCRLCW